MDETASKPAESHGKISVWIYVLVLLLVSVGILYVLIASSVSRDATATGRTPLGEAAFSLIQSTLRASSSPAARAAGCLFVGWLACIDPRS